MRQRVYKDLAELERIHAAALQVRALRDRPSGTAMFGELVSRHATERVGGESLAETVARAAGISARELKDLLWERTY